jgi:hypothetical protein
MSAYYYTLTFIPGCNKNIYHVKVIVEGTNDEVEKKFCDITGVSHEDVDSQRICDPFNCFDCESFNCDEKCECLSIKEETDEETKFKYLESYKCYRFNNLDKIIYQKIKLSKGFVDDCPCTIDHFRIDKWKSKDHFNFNKKKLIDIIRSQLSF